MADLIEITTTPAYDGFAGAGPGDPTETQAAQHPLDSEDNRKLLGMLEDWWTEARDAHAANRREQMIDADYYDGLQWREEDARVLMERGQAPLTFPLIKLMVDWVIGTERRTRIDWNVLPRKNTEVQIAQVKKELLKYVSDVNGAGWERSRQFEDIAKVGVGWVEECYNADRFEEPVTLRHQDWRGMWWDPFSRDNALRDCRYLTRAKWLDLDYAIAMVPDRADVLRTHAVTTLDATTEMLALENDLPMMFWHSQNPLGQTVGTTTGTFGMFGTASVARRPRARVLGLETWFRKAVNVKLMLGDEEWHGQTYDPSDAGMQAAVESQAVSLLDSVSEEMWVALWTPGALLRVMRSPYKHKRFPFTPAWAYRRGRDGMPYGMVRPARDPSDDYNKRRSKLQYDLSTNRVVYEADAMDEADEARNLEEARRPDGEIRLAPGALKDQKFQIQSATAANEGQFRLMEESKANVFELSGVTRDNVGQESSASSGRAILAKQQQGAVTTASLFDNYRQSNKLSGEKMLSNTEQFMTMPKVFRIVGPAGQIEWRSINTPRFDPATGQVIFENDITASEADFVIDEMDYRETVRLALSEQMFDLLSKQPPDVALALLDLAYDLTDIPNKDAIVARIRALNGQPPPGQENTPEAKQAQEQKQADAQRRAQLQDENLAADTRHKNAQADRLGAEARRAEVQGKQAALQTAHALAAAPGAAGAADEIYNGGTPPTPAPAAAPATA